MKNYEYYEKINYRNAGLHCGHCSRYHNFCYQLLQKTFEMIMTILIGTLLLMVYIIVCCATTAREKEMYVNRKGQLRQRGSVEAIEHQDSFIG
jgi:hypothetical protein